MLDVTVRRRLWWNRNSRFKMHKFIRVANGMRGVMRIILVQIRRIASSHGQPLLRLGGIRDFTLTGSLEHQGNIRTASQE